MCQYMLYTTQYKEEVLEKMQEPGEEDISFKLEKMEQVGDANVFIYDLPNDVYFVENFAKIISDIVQKQTILLVCEKCLKENEELLPIEKEEIKKAFIQNNYVSRQEGYSATTYYLIYVPILYAIQEKRQFNIEGWIGFRTKKYQTLLRELLEQFVSNYLIKKDVINFIKVMRDISMLSVPLEEVLNVIYNDQGQLKVYNKEMKDMTLVYIKKYCKDLILDSTVSREDLIMQILITICPSQIVVHGKKWAKEPQFLKTLEVIFDTQVEYCKGCKYCQD